MAYGGYDNRDGRRWHLLHFSPERKSDEALSLLFTRSAAAFHWSRWSAEFPARISFVISAPRRDACRCASSWAVPGLPKRRYVDRSSDGARCGAGWRRCGPQRSGDWPGVSDRPSRCTTCWRSARRTRPVDRRNFCSLCRGTTSTHAAATFVRPAVLEVSV